MSDSPNISSKAATTTVLVLCGRHFFAVFVILFSKYLVNLKLRAPRVPFISMASSRPPLGFFSLPRELRDTIYHLYVYEPQGYQYDLKSGKLRAHGERHIDLALVRTCSAIAAEMRHLPLQINVLHFSTSSNPLESERSVSAHFDMLLTHKQLGNCLALFVVNEPTLLHYRTPDVNAKLALRYPQFAPMLQPTQQVAVSGLKPCFSSSLHASGWGEAESLFIAFQSHMIELLSTGTDFREALLNFYETEYGEPRFQCCRKRFLYPALIPG